MNNLLLLIYTIKEVFVCFADLWGLHFMVL